MTSWFLFNSVEIQMPEQTISKRDNTWLLQVCKHVISCIPPMCNKRPFRTYNMLWTEALLVEATFSRDTQRGLPEEITPPPPPPKQSPVIAKLNLRRARFNILPENVYFSCLDNGLIMYNHCLDIDVFSYPKITLKVFIFNILLKLKVYICSQIYKYIIISLNWHWKQIWEWSNQCNWQMT